MQIQQNTPLAPFTSFGVGGPAEKLITLTDSTEIDSALIEAGDSRLWLLGHGTNVLISDAGLPGATIRLAIGNITAEGNTLIAEAGAAWDDLVKFSIDRKLWGIELMSGIPGSVGAGVFINLAAYGQTQSNTLVWVEVIDRASKRHERLDAKKLMWSYKQSYFQDRPNLVIARAAYELSTGTTTELTYQWALDTAKDLGLTPDTLEHRRQIILETRRRAGSIFVYGQGHAMTVGSFFRNPLVTPEQAEIIESFDESGRTKEQIAKMNQVHGGDIMRVSANHVMLAAGFKRGQTWGPVRLHPEHVLKIENTGGATAQDIYDVAQEIIRTVKDKLGITLEPEARILGKFS